MRDEKIVQIHWFISILQQENGQWSANSHTLVLRIRQKSNLHSACGLLNKKSAKNYINTHDLDKFQKQEPDFQRIKMCSKTHDSLS